MTGDGGEDGRDGVGEVTTASAAEAGGSGTEVVEDPLAAGDRKATEVPVRQPQVEATIASPIRQTSERFPSRAKRTIARDCFAWERWW